MGKNERYIVIKRVVCEHCHGSKVDIESISELDNSHYEYGKLDDRIATFDGCSRCDEQGFFDEEIDLIEAVAAVMRMSREDVERGNWERLSFQEIGQQMDRSADAVRKVWSRAVERLQIELEQEFGDDGEPS